eukprot:TRINITY_DN1502_c0_g1_i6.p1 TRINITY_DN1502_c0_g1~~TRINITY_DN1502_c0_g1_i6.p1  ORF type:complete len:575 (+),score=72.82 TRINITY_DN1502_c0_g1_i6:64-1788(+)
MATLIEVSVALCACFILCVALFVRACECLVALGPLKLSSWSVSSSLRKLFRVALLLETEEPVDAVAAYALELLHREQLACTRSVCWCFPILASAFNILFNAWLAEGESVYIVFSEAQHVVLCITAGAFILLRCFWSCNAPTSPKIAKMIYVGACLSVILFVMFARGSRFHVGRTLTLALTLGFVVVFARMDTCLVIFWNVLFFTASIVKHAAADAGTRSEFPPTWNLAVPVMCIVAIQIFAAHQLYTSTRESCWNEARAKWSSIEQGALGKLLEGACDVVVSVDSSFSILEEAKRFSAMLMYNVTHSLRGQNILDHIAKEEDRERFQKSFRSMSSSLEPQVSTLKLHLRDSRGSEVNVDSMGVAYRDVDGTQKYLIGIRELSDFQPRPIRELRRATTAPAEEVNDKPNGTQAFSPRGTAAIAINQPLPRHAQDVDGTRANTARGSAANVIGQPLPRHALDAIDEPDARSSSSRSGRSCVHRHLASPLWQETSEYGKFESLLSLIASWNCKLPPGCCSAHMTVPEVKRMLEKIAKMMCKHQLHMPQSQCTSCGILGSCEEDLMCNICHHDETIGL